MIQAQVMTISTLTKYGACFLFSGLLSCVACRSGLQRPSLQEVLLAQKRWHECDLNSLKAGLTLYTTHCGQCHELYKPLAYSEDSWLDCLPEMAKRARITPEEQLLIRRFLLTRRTYTLEKKK